MKKLFPGVAALLPGGVFSLLLASSALASSGEVEMIPFFSSNFLWAVINFAILVFLLVKFGKKPFQDAMAKRQQTIVTALKEAEEAKVAAERRLAEVEQRLRAKDDEVKAILDEAKVIAAREKEKMIVLGRELSEQIAGQTRDNLDQEVKKAGEALRGEAVALAMEIAERRIQSALDGAAQERIVGEALEKMEALK